MPCQPVEQVIEGRLVDLGDLDQRGPAKAPGPEPAALKREIFLVAERGRVALDEGEAPWHGPFAGLGGLIEDMEIRGIESDGARKLHHSDILVRRE